MKTIKALAAILITSTLTSCCVILQGKSQTVIFKSNVPEAKVMVNTRDIGKTNEYIEVKRSDLDGLFRISKDGCKTKEMELPLKMSTCWWGTAFMATVPFFGGVIATTDLAGQNSTETEDVIHADLDCTGKK